MRSLKKKKQDIIWEKKWRNLIHQKEIKEEMNKQLKASLERQKQEEEEKECTFKPQTLWNHNFKKTISFVDEFFDKLRPYIEKQQEYLNQLKELDLEDQKFSNKIKEELRLMLYKATDKEIMEAIIESYKGVRTRGINKVKREKLDILSKMIKLEREYNSFMARENVDKKDLEECGFDCDLAAKLRNDILKESLCPNSLKDFAKIRQEINQVLEEELKVRENQNISNAMNNESELHQKSCSITGFSINYSNAESEENIAIKDSNTLSNKCPNSIEINENYKCDLNNMNNIAQITNESNHTINNSNDYILNELEQMNSLEYFNSETAHNNMYNNSPSIKENNNYNKKNCIQHIKERDEFYAHNTQNEPRKLEHTNLYNINNQKLEKNNIENKCVNNNKNIYLNSNYMKMLRNEDANKYVDSLQKDLNSMNVIILNNKNKNANNDINKDISNFPMNHSEKNTVSNYINENSIGAGAFNQMQNLHVMGKKTTTIINNKNNNGNNYIYSNNNINNSLKNTGIHALKNEQPRNNIEQKNMYVIQNNNKNEILYNDINYTFDKSINTRLKEHTSTDTTHIDKIVYNNNNNNSSSNNYCNNDNVSSNCNNSNNTNMNNISNLYDKYSNNNANKQLNYNKNPFYTNNANDKMKKAHLANAGKEKLTYTNNISSNDENKYMSKNKSIFNKIIENFPIYQKIK